MKSNYVIKHLTGTLLFFLVLFISAGRLNYWQGLVYTGIGLIMFILSHTVLRMDPGLLNERSKPGEGANKWDKTILGLSFLATLSLYITAGLDSGRYHGSPDFHPAIYSMGILFTVAGQLLFLIAQKQNSFFSAVFRIQTNRQHTVCDTGIYGFVRHPAYLGSVIQAIGFPVLFGSYWSMIPASLIIILHLLRTHLEDEALKKEITGYREYTLKTRYRLIPYIW